MLKFYKITGPETVVNYLASQLSRRLANGQKVLWLLSGGSFITIEVAVAARLRGLAELANLTISLVDERWGPPGHPDSNWRQLMDKGFELEGATLAPVLGGQGLSQTGRQFQKDLSASLQRADFKFALIGMGSDGHVLGVKPDSLAVTSDQLVEAYSWSDYQRVTTTAELMGHLDEAVVYAVGEEKRPQLEKLSSDLSIAEQPAQMLKLCSKVIIFNDQIGDEFKED